MRYLRARRLVTLDSGLWALDDVQPVAAVLDPATGQLRRVVDWREQPPPPRGEPWPPLTAIGAGESLWVQQEGTGPLVRVTDEGVQTVVWTDGLMLRTAVPSAAWCTLAPPDQELVTGADATPVDLRGAGELLRVERDGTCTTVRTDTPVVSVTAQDGAVLVEVETGEWSLHCLGGDTYEVVRSSRWLRLPDKAPLPETLTIEGHAVPDAEWTPRTVHGDPGEDMDSQGVESITGGGALGPGSVWTSARIAAGLVASVARPHVPGTESPRVDLLLLDPDGARPPRVLLPGDAVEVSEHCWPLVSRPIEEESYTRRALAQNADLEHCWRSPDGTVSPLVEGLRDARTELVGQWPDTVLQWTFAYDRYPGVQLRRRVPLFDELGRIAAASQLISIHLMEDLHTRAFDPAQARDGILAI